MAALLPTALRAQPGDFTVKSPDGKIVVVVAPGERLKYSVVWSGKPIIQDAALGITIDGDDLGMKTRMNLAPQIQLLDDHFPVRGVHAVGRTRCNSALIALTGGEPSTDWTLEIRAFDDGVACRYIVPGDARRHIEGESTAWNLPSGSILWYLGGKNRSYEDHFHNKPIEELEPGTEIMAMATAELPASGGYAMIAEANLVHYSDLALEASGANTLRAVFHDDPQGWTQDAGAVVSPWRVTLLAPDLNTLVNCDIIRSLCPAPSADFEHADYIRPGRSLWHWLVSGRPKPEEQHAWIDGARQMGFEFYLVDAGWKNWDGGGEKAWKTLAGVANYAKSQNVGLWAWVAAHEVSDPAQREEYFQHARRIGLAGLKIDFPDAPGYRWVNWYDDTLRDAARAGLMVDFHGAVKPTGRDRTWPNEMTREAIAGREYGKNPASHETALPFVRYVQGNADYTPTMFDPAKLKGSSLAHELAMSIVYTSPFLCYADAPKRYLQSDAVEVIEHTPATWDATTVLPASRIGKLAAFARRHGDQWFVGIINGGDAHEETVPLDFLGAGNYRLVELADSPDGNDAFKRSERVVTRMDSLHAPLRQDGGYVAWLQPVTGMVPRTDNEVTASPASPDPGDRKVKAGRLP